MKAALATLISGIIFLASGIFLWIKYDTTTKWFSLAGNLIVAGVAIILVALLIHIKVKKW